MSTESAKRRRKLKQSEWVEALFGTDALYHGLDTFKPTSNNGPIDWVVAYNNRVLRVQVRGTTEKRSPHTYRCKTSYVHKGQTKNLGPKQIDFLAAYVIPEDTWYIVPARLASSRRFLSGLGLGGKCERYREAWCLFKNKPVPSLRRETPSY